MSISILPTIVDRLQEITAVTNVTDRIRIGHPLQKDDYPWVAVEFVQSVPDGELLQFSGNVITTIRVHCVARSMKEAIDLANACKHGRTDNDGASDGLIDWSGTLSGRTLQELNWVDDGLNLIEPDDGEPNFVYDVYSTFTVEYREPTLTGAG